jgi:hypothetical protein
MTSCRPTEFHRLREEKGFFARNMGVVASFEMTASCQLHGAPRYEDTYNKDGANYIYIIMRHSKKAFDL